MDAENEYGMVLPADAGSEKIVCKILAYKQKIYLECVYKGQVDLWI